MLNKEECLKAYEIIDTLLHLMCGEEREDGYKPTMEEMVKSMEAFNTLIKGHFKGIKDLDEIIKIQKNNLTNDYMIGLYNGLVTAKCVIEDKDNGGLMINCEEDNPPLKFEELEVYTPYWHEEERSWCYFTTLNKDMQTGVQVLIGSVPMMSAFKFKEGVFYNKEVKE